MSNVTKGDLAYVVGLEHHPKLQGRVVTVCERYHGEDFYSVNGIRFGLADVDPTKTAWWITASTPLALDTHIGRVFYHRLPIADNNLRRIAGPSVPVEGFTAIEIFPDIRETDRVASAVQLRKTTHL